MNKYYINSILKEAAESIRERRIAENWSRNELAERSGVSYGTLIKFETTGKISFISFVKLLTTLKMEQEFLKFLNDTTEIPSDKFERMQTRKRAWRKQ